VPRDSQTIAHFKGIDTFHSAMVVPPTSALNCQNVLDNGGGFLEAAQQPTVLFDPTGHPTANLSRILSAGVLEIAGSQPRLFFQEGGSLFYLDAPNFTDITSLLAQEFPEALPRLDWVLANEILYFSTVGGQGKVLPGNPSYYRWGIARPATAPTLVASTSSLGVTSISRAGGVTTVVFANPYGAGTFDGQPVTVDNAGPWPASFAGTFKIISATGGNTVTYAQPGQPDDPGPHARANYPGGITAVTGWQWGVALGYNRGGRVHWSTLSPYSASSGPVTDQAPAVMSPPTDDPQVNQAAFFRNLDGGGDWYLETILPIPTTGDFPGQVVYVDSTLDNPTLIASGQTPPYDNGVAPNGKYVCPLLDRVLMCGIEGDEITVRYTGFDSINFGNPQESWCQFNGIAIGEGQSAPNGIGRVRYGGVVIFCTNRRMYLLHGSLNDITISAPTSLAFYVEDLPYEIGCYSHFTIQSTPAGLVWLDDGLNLRLFDPSTYYPPKMLAPNLKGYFARMTPGSVDTVTSAYINWLDRDWYVISIPVDGSLTNNLTLLVDVDPDPNTNTGCWPLTHSVTELVVVKYADSSTHILAAQSQLYTPDPPPTAGYITEILLSASETNGIQSPTADDNPLMPDAFWSGGYIGIKDEGGQDTWPEMKMFRFVRASTGLTLLPVSYSIVDAENYTFDLPLTGNALTADRVSSINMKGRACSCTFHFPQQAASPLLSFTLSWRVTGVR
jgi:hypothetical protein